MSSKNISNFVPVMMLIFSAGFPGGTFDLEPQEVVLTAENVTGKALLSDGLELLGRVENDVCKEFCGEHGNYSQSPMPVEPCEVMDIFDSAREPSIRMAQRFFSNCQAVWTQARF
jgi:hypothetical protein